MRLAAWLCQLFPVSVLVVEDIKATTRGKKRWDQSFSPLEVGKAWFYEGLGKLAPVQTLQGYHTKELREQLGLKKTGRKMAEVWEDRRGDLLQSGPPGYRGLWDCCQVVF